MRARAWLCFGTLALSLGFGCADEKSSNGPQDAELGGGVAAAGKGSAGSAMSFAGVAGHASGAVGGGGDAGEPPAGGVPSTSVAGDTAGGEGGVDGDGSEPRTSSGNAGVAGNDGVSGSGGMGGLAGAGGVGGTVPTAGYGGVAGSTAGYGGIAGSTAGYGGVAGTAGSGGGPVAGTLPCEVQAVLKARCTTCHGSPPANNAPMSLLTWSNFQAYAADIEEKLGAALMPPPAAPSLSQAQLSTLQTYLSLGAPSAGNITCP